MLQNTARRGPQLECARKAFAKVHQQIEQGIDHGMA